MTSVSKQPYDFIFKVIIIGDTGVGKTNMILRFSEGSFKENYVATIGVDFKIKTLSVGDKRIRLQLWDTAGQERFRTITETYYKGAAGIVLTYSVDNRRTFQNLCTGMLYVEKWMKQIKQKTPPNIQKLIIGNKSDLEDCREVKFEEGVKMAEQFSEPGNKVEFMEVSAKTGKNVSEGFHKICEQIKQYIENSHFNTTEGKTSVLKLDRHDERKKCAC